MKKSVIVLTLLLIASIAGTYAVWELYVKARLRELGEHMAQEEQLRTKISQLESKFFNTRPENILQVYRQQTQPWANAADRRTEFFNLGDIPLEATIPEEAIPKFYYREIHPKMIETLQTETSATLVPGYAFYNFGIPSPDTYGGGTNPTAKEIEGHLVQWEFGAAMTRMLTRARATNIKILRPWPEKIVFKARTGDINARTTGLKFDISVRDFVAFLDQLAQDDRYFEIEAMKVVKRNLRDKEAMLEVDMILTQAYFSRAKKTRPVGTLDGDSDAVNDMFSGMFGGTTAGAAAAPEDEESELSWWQNFRRNYIPF